MKNKKLSKISFIGYFIVLGLAIIFLIAVGVSDKVTVFNSRQSSGRLMQLSPKYELTENADTPLGIAEYYYFKLNEPIGDKDSISFYTSHRNINIYVDDKLSFSLEADRANPFGSTPASNVVIFDLLPSDYGKEITIEIIPVYKQVVGGKIDFYKGDKKDIYVNYLDEEIAPAVLSFVPLLLGLVFLVMGAFVVKEKESKVNIAMLGVFSAELGIWKLLDLAIAPLIFDKNPIFISFFSTLMLSFLIYPFLYFIKSLITKEYVIFDYLSVLIIASYLVTLSLQVFNIADLRESLMICHVTLAVTLIVVVVTLAYEAFRHQDQPQLMVTVFGMMLCTLGLIYDLIIYYILKSSVSTYMGLLCFDIYISVMGIIIAHDSHKMIVDAKRRAEEANSAKSRFLSNMSHDIRTPMNAIVGFTDIAEKYSDDPERLKDALDKIKSSSDHLLKLINDVLDMSKIESGKIVLDVQPGSISSTLENVCSMMTAQMQDKGIEFIVDVDNIEHNYIYFDLLRVNQVILNLLGNAYKFTQPGGYVKLSVVEMPSEDPAKATYQIRVKDTGIGMSEEFRVHAFDAFLREHDSSGNNIQGTGLGLSISKSIVELGGGTIKVESLLGAGSEFIIDISFYIASEEDVPKPVENIEEIEFVGQRILLVDDNQLNREIVVEILSALDLVVECAEDGDIAVDKVLHAPTGYYKLVLMDIQMPVMNGYEATRTIREFDDPGKADIPIIAMTANAFEEDRLHAYEAGMNAHVAKPIDIDELLKVLNTFLN